MATHNGAEYIKEQLDSVLCQIGKDDEIIVSDDGSTDDTVSIIEAYNDPRIKIHHYKQAPVKSDHSKFYYAARNFENALKHASGDYIFLCDQDDIWNKDKIKIMLPYLRKYECVHHGKYDMYVDGTPMQIHYPMPDKTDIFNGLAKMRFAGCCMGITRKLKDKALPFPTRIPTHDGWLACMALSMNSYYYIPEPLIKHRIHGNNVSYRNGAKGDLWYSLRFRFHIIANLIARGALRH